MNIHIYSHIETDEYIVDPWRAQGTIKLIRVIEKDI